MGRALCASVKDDLPVLGGKVKPRVEGWQT